MKKFKFPYQRVMEWREHRAEQAKSELERLHGVREQLSQSRSHLQNELKQLSEQHADQGSTSSESLHMAAMFSRSLQILDKRLRTDENRCANQILSQQQTCLTEDRGVKLLSQLHDNSRRQWQYEADRTLEEIASEAWNAGYARQLSRVSDQSE